MAEGDKGFGEQLFSRLKGKGLSRGQVYKVLALQRLDPEVSELGDKGLLNEAQLLEISKIASAARQKQLAQLAAEKKLAASWVKELSKIIRKAEKADSDIEANRCWDFFFEVKEQIEKDGAKRNLLKQIKSFRPDVPRGEKGSEDVFESDERRLVPFNTLNVELGRGLDVGTVNICAAARESSGKIHYNIQRDAFLDVRSDKYTRKMLMKLGIDYLVQGDKGYVVGDPAFELANIFEKATRRPMKDGMISPLEPEALMIVNLLIAQLLGRPGEDREICAYSVPADPIDVDRNVVYHRGALESVLRKLGYSPKPILEGHAVVFAELKEQDYTGIGLSGGGGMFNVCVAYKGLPALSLSTSRGGDWVDNNVAHALGMPTSTVCSVKESGCDILNPKDRVEDAIAIYYRNLISYTLETICKKFETAQHMPHFNKPVDLVCAGGTSIIKGFIQIFREEFEKVDFPVKIREIRMATDPLRTVAAGCLQAANEEMEAMKETDIHDVPLERAEVSSMDRFATEVRERLGGVANAPKPEPEPEAPKQAREPEPPPPEPESKPEPEAEEPPAPPTLETRPGGTPPEDPDIAEVDRQLQTHVPRTEPKPGNVSETGRQFQAGGPDGEVDDGDVSQVERQLKPAPAADTSGSAPRLSALNPPPPVAEAPPAPLPAFSGTLGGAPMEASVPPTPARKIPPPSTEEPNLEEVEPGVFRPAGAKADKPENGEAASPKQEEDVPEDEAGGLQELEEVEEAGAPSDSGKDDDGEFPIIS